MQVAGGKNLYFVGPLTDGLAMGGVSLLFFLYYLLVPSGYARIQVSETAVYLSTVFGWLLSKPHIAATAYRLYQAPGHARQNPFSALVFPVLLVLAVILGFAFPAGFAPWWVKLALLWAPFHYSAQNFGLVLLYARRAGIPVSRDARWVLNGFLVSAVLAQTTEAEAYHGTMEVLGVSYPLLGLPAWVPKVAFWNAIAFAVLLGGVGLVWMLRNRRPMPWIVWLPACAQLVWAVAGASLPSFVLLVPVFHALQFVLVAWAAEMHLQAQVAERPLPAKNSFLLTKSTFWWGVNGAGALLMFWAIPRGMSSLGWELAFCSAMFQVTFQIHHYFVDGVLWKLRHAGESSPLLTHYSVSFRT